MKLNEFLNLSIEELYNFIKDNIEYGWVDTKGIKHYGANSVDLEYHLQSPKETLDRKVAICWDKTELLRYYFEKNGYEVYTYFIYLYITDDYCPSHSICVYKENNNYIWFEANNCINLNGIRTYKTENDLIHDLKLRFFSNGFLNEMFNENDDLTKYYIYKYDKPKFYIRGSKFYNHIRTGKSMDKEYVLKYVKEDNK